MTVILKQSVIVYAFLYRNAIFGCHGCNKINRPLTIELPQFVRTVQKAPYVGNIKF